jgi:hypothetical protein
VQAIARLHGWATDRPPGFPSASGPWSRDVLLGGARMTPSQRRRIKITVPSVPVSQGQSRGSGGSWSWLVSGPNRVGRSDSQADSAGFDSRYPLHPHLLQTTTSQLRSSSVMITGISLQVGCPRRSPTRQDSALTSAAQDSPPRRPEPSGWPTDEAGWFSRTSVVLAQTER